LTARIDQILNFLATNENEHTLEEVSASLGIPLSVCRRVAIFLGKYGFIEFNGSKMRIDPKIKEFILNSAGEETLAADPFSSVAACTPRKKGRLL